MNNRNAHVHAGPECMNFNERMPLTSALISNDSKPMQRSRACMCMWCMCNPQPHRWCIYAKYRNVQITRRCIESTLPIQVLKNGKCRTQIRGDKGAYHMHDAHGVPECMRGSKMCAETATMHGKSRMRCDFLPNLYESIGLPDVTFRLWKFHCIACTRASNEPM